jgi:hypothetical protein
MRRFRTSPEYLREKSPIGDSLRAELTAEVDRCE